MWSLSRLHTDKADAQHLWLLLRPRRERPRRWCMAALPVRAQEVDRLLSSNAPSLKAWGLTLLPRASSACGRASTPRWGGRRIFKNY